MRKAKIRKLTIEGFRGVLKETHLDFGDPVRSLVLYADNGDGKSSFADALEWFYTDRIGHLQREGCTRRDYFNLRLPDNEDAFVKVEFSDPGIGENKKTLRRAGGHKDSSRSAMFYGYLEAASREELILRLDTMRGSVDKRKAEKLEYLENIVGFQAVRNVRHALLQARNALEQDAQLQRLRGRRDQRSDDVARLLARREFAEASCAASGSRGTCPMPMMTSALPS